MDTDQLYEQRVVWILRQTRLTPLQLMQQYVAYKDQRAAFECGHGTAGDMTALITPGVVAMLDLEEQMLAAATAEQKLATEKRIGKRSGWIDCAIVVVFLCAIIIMLAWHG